MFGSAGTLSKLVGSGDAPDDPLEERFSVVEVRGSVATEERFTDVVDAVPPELMPESIVVRVLPLLPPVPLPELPPV